MFFSTCRRSYVLCSKPFQSSWQRGGLKIAHVAKLPSHDSNVTSPAGIGLICKLMPCKQDDIFTMRNAKGKYSLSWVQFSNYSDNDWPWNNIIILHSPFENVVWYNKDTYYATSCIVVGKCLSLFLKFVTYFKFVSAMVNNVSYLKYTIIGQVRVNEVHRCHFATQYITDYFLNTHASIPFNY